MTSPQFLALVCFDIHCSTDGTSRDSLLFVGGPTDKFEMAHLGCPLGCLQLGRRALPDLTTDKQVGQSQEARLAKRTDRQRTVEELELKRREAATDWIDYVLLSSAKESTFI